MLLSCSEGGKKEFISHGTSCGKLINTVNQGSKIDSTVALIYERGWVNGYVTAFNKQRGGDVFSSTDTESVLAVMIQYCEENPLLNTSDAIQLAINFLTKKK